MRGPRPEHPDTIRYTPLVTRDQCLPEISDERHGLGMALLTILTGNAFAAFPVMATAIGIPLLIQGYGGDPAVVGAIGMLAGFCGTLMTPMAANFNIVPVALLELKDDYAVIRAQIGTAIPLLVVNILLIYFLAF